jgi:hypothetical protein
MLLRLVYVLVVFLVCLHLIHCGLVQRTENATQKWSRVSYRYQRLYRVSYYSVHEEQRTWFEASNVCAAEGAHLLIINSQQEAEAVKRILDPSVETYSIGFHDLFEQTQFRTVQCTY